jgi:PAS domain S-box-containing protein
MNDQGESGQGPIIERSETEQALQQAHDELRAIYDGMVDGMLIADRETRRFVRANSAICRMLGYSMEELLSRSVDDIHPPANLPYVLEKFRENAEGKLWIAEELPVLRRDGTVFYADIATNRLHYRERPCVIGFFRDITERKQARDALACERRTLEHLLQSSDHERQVIAYEIHDGLAQYLAGATMQFEVYDHLKDTRPKDAANAFLAGLTMLRQSHSEARRLISGVRPPILDEEGIVAAVAHLVNEQREPKGPRIQYRTKIEFERLAPVLENAVYRIVQEGLANACRHSRSNKVWVELVQEGQQLRIDIRDRGVGFRLQDIDENRFGLHGIRERARLLGGTCRIESEPGKGTRIVVEVPLVPRRAEQATVGPSPADG